MRSAYAQQFGAHARPLLWQWLEAAGVVLVPALVLVPVAVLRFIDVDEGSYVLTAKLVSEGNTPYIDFAHGQTPLLPYVYGLWTLAAGENWYLARLLSVAFALALGGLLYRHVAVRHSRGLALLGLVLLGSTSLAVVWFATVKTYALSTVLLFGAYVLVERRDPSWRSWAAAGVLLGLAIDTRLIFVVAVPAFAWAAFRTDTGMERRRRLVEVGGGLTLGLTPCFAFLLLDPDRFLFDNLGAHGFRDSSGLVGDLSQKLRVAADVLVSTGAGRNPQYLLLTLLAVAAGLTLYALRRRVPLALLLAGSLAFGSLLPTPTYSQYFCVTVPFLIVGALEVIACLRDRAALRPETRRMRTLGAVIGLCAMPYVAVGVIDLRRWTTLYEDQRIDRAQTVAAIIDVNTSPGEEVLSSWPGYLFETHAVQFPGLESDFAPAVAASLSPEDARHHLRATVSRVEQAIRNQRTRLVTLKRWHNLEPTPDWETKIRASDYILLATVAPEGRAQIGAPVYVFARPRE